MNKIMVTGSSGLIGSQIVERFCALGWQFYGIGNHLRMDLFGPIGDTLRNQTRLLFENSNCTHKEIEIRDRSAVAPFMLVECISGLPLKYEYLDNPRIGDHMFKKIKSHFLDWKIHKSFEKIFNEIYESLSSLVKNGLLKTL